VWHRIERDAESSVLRRKRVMIPRGRIKLHRPNIAASCLVAISILGPKDAALVWSHAGRRTRIDRRTSREWEMGQRGTTIVLQGTKDACEELLKRND
jgi:hypothetical protein